MRSHLAALLLSLLVAAPRSPARVLRVAMDGAGPDGASWQTAYPSVSQALLASAPGDEVWVARGAYPESVKLADGVALYGGFAGVETARDPRNPAANDTLLPGPLAGGPCVVANWVGGGARVDGFTLRPHNPDVYALTCSVASPVITGCRIEEASIGVACSVGAAPVIAGNTISMCTVGVNCSESSPSVLDNVIEGCEYGIHTGKLSSPLVVNNTVAGNSRALDFQSGSPATANNILALNAFGVYVRSGGAPTLKNNLVWQNDTADYDGTGDPTGLDGNLRADPRFVDPLNSDYRLLPGSPCIDAGLGGASTWPADRDGGPRVMGAAVDIGAYEYRAGGGAAEALRIAGGLMPSTPADMDRLNAVTQPPSAAIDILDAVRLLRR